jgi:type II secretory pathway pseudopilin PulG
MGRAPGRRARPETGDTLIELLVAVVIIGFSFVIIVGGVGVAIIGAGIQQNQSSADSLLKSSAEIVAGTAVPYTCTEPIMAYQMALPTPPPGSQVAVTVVNVAYWDSASNQFDATTCSDTGMQLVTLSATSTTIHVPGASTLEIVKPF